jgi:hypothetical protein
MSNLQSVRRRDCSRWAVALQAMLSGDRHAEGHRLAVLAAAACLWWALTFSWAGAASYRTANFVVTAPTASFAESVCREAEVLRDELAVLWLGEKLPKWAEPCPVTLQVGEQLGAGGATSFVFDHGEVFNWRMSIQGSERGILYSVLPHEITHTIFASYFRQPLPRWADEGACTTVEDESERAKQRHMLISFLKEDRGIAFSRMFVMKEYPQDVMPLYAQGFSLCRYLLEQRDRRTFVRFLSDGLASNQWHVAINTHYGFSDLAQLQHAWLEWVKAGSPVTHVAAYPQGPMDCSNCRDRAMAQQQMVQPHMAAQQRGPSTYAQTPKPQIDPYTPRPPDPPPPKKLAPTVEVPPASQPAAAVAPGPADDKPNTIHVTEQELVGAAAEMAIKRLDIDARINAAEERLRQKLANAKECGPGARAGGDDELDCSGKVVSQPCRGEREACSQTPSKGQASQANSAGWLDWLGDKASPLAIAGMGMLGISPPLAAIVWYLTRRAGKRELAQLDARIIHQWRNTAAAPAVPAAPASPPAASPAPTVVSGPPLPQVATHDTNYVPYAVNSEWSLALDRAMDLYVRRYPGGDVAASTIRGLAKQIQSGQIKP